MSEVDQKNLDTPMMRQFLEIKKQYPDDILFFRMGDFYEMFLEDAVYASRVLDIALTRRQDKVPMCGVPYHSMSQYVHPILEQGRRIAICEQLEDPAEAQGRIVRRGVTRILTPGSLFEESLIDGKDSRRLCGVTKGKTHWQLAIIEVATGQIWFDRKDDETLGEALAAFGIREWVAPESEAFEPPAAGILQTRRYPIGDEAFRARVLKDALQTKNLGIWELDDDEERALTLALAYLREISPVLKMHWSSPQREYRRKTMILDASTLRTLEILSSAEGKLNPSLLGLFAHCHTSAGSRLLAGWLSRPSADLEDILSRHDTVEILAKHNSYRQLLAADLGHVADLERVLTGLDNNPTVRHLGQVAATLKAIVRLQKIISDNRMAPLLSAGWQNLKDFPSELLKFLEDAVLTENLPPLLDSRRFVNPGYMPLLDEFIELSQNAVKHLTDYEERQKAEHQINTLRVKHNNVLGYFIEISKGQANKAPEAYARRQTLTNAERYTTAELKELETKILSAEEEVLRIQKGVFEDIRSQILAAADKLKLWAGRLARLDVLLAFAHAAVVHRHVRPHMTAERTLSAESLRHPVIEAYFRSEMFIPNDVLLNNSDRHLAIITGPNMAGKSTYIRQIGIMQIMAQAGAFVAATSATLPVVDRIFTRIGAQDRLSHGESTFYVEMAECARIFRNYTADSLILLDEVGRGTSTYDGISIAQAMIESLNDIKTGRPKTLFATHYSELAHLISKERGIAGLTVSVIEKDGHVVFMRKIIEGVADKSYGIHVAQMAGMPKAVTERAAEILRGLEEGSGDLLTSARTDSDLAAPVQKKTAKPAVQGEKLQNKKQSSFDGPDLFGV
jgi:DNA mismatch repair protein MutS